MRCNTVRSTSYGGKYSPEEVERENPDELVLGRSEIAHVLRALRRSGTPEDKDFAKKILDTVSPAFHCDCCGRRLSGFKSSINQMHAKNLCRKCSWIMHDIKYCDDMAHLDKLDLEANSEKYLRQLESIQRSRSAWAKSSYNFLVNKKTFSKCLAKYRELFGKKKMKKH